MQNLVAICHTISRMQEVPLLPPPKKKSRGLGPLPSFGIGIMRAHGEMKHAPSHTCNHTLPNLVGLGKTVWCRYRFNSKILLSSSLVTMQNLVVVCHTISRMQEVPSPPPPPKKKERAGTFPSFGIGIMHARDELKHAPSHTCYHSFLLTIPLVPGYDND